MKISILPILLTSVGGYFLIKLRFFFITHPLRTMGKGLRAIKDSRAVKSFTLALAGTLGVGNIFGVAIGLIIGGPGSLFWLLVSMFFAMAIKYAEVVITGDNLYHDGDTHGGFFFVIRSSFSRLGVVLSKFYALLILLLSFILGAALQSDAVLESVSSSTVISALPVAALFTFLVLISIIGEARIIEKITVIVIPLSTIIYIFMTLYILIVNSERMGETVSMIMMNAFKYDSALGGVLGFIVSMPVCEGFARGMLSNEAGAGTSSMAHARSGLINPSVAGIMGIFEVWFDTGVICMLTGLSILISVPDIGAFQGGMELVMYMVGNHFGSLGKYVLLFCVFAFAFATVICWYYYGMECWFSLFRKRKRAVFTLLFLTFVFVGCYMNSFLLVSLTDALMSCATILTLFALIKNSDRIKHLSESGGVIDSDKSRIKPFKIKGNVLKRAGKHR